MQIYQCSSETIDEWLRLRSELWPQDAALHRQEIEHILVTPDKFVAFVAYDGAAGVGFAEAALRFDYVNGCETSPIVFLEGIYVRPDRRRMGVARQLCASVERWGIRKGCTELASDALLENDVSHRMHAALGFEETERVVFFRKPLTPS
jgi:aminoglycoside 6'-N-acetyltransferase I